MTPDERIEQLKIVVLLDQIRDLPLHDRRVLLATLLSNWCFEPDPDVVPCPEEHDENSECDRCGGTDIIDGLPCGKRLDPDGDVADVFCDGEHEVIPHSKEPT